MNNTTHDDLLRRMDQMESKSGTARESIAGALGRIETMLGNHGAVLKNINERVTELEADGNQRKGRDGVWAAIMRSPVIPWIAAIGAALWAGVKSLAAHTPAVLLATVLVAMCAIPAIAKPAQEIVR